MPINLGFHEKYVLSLSLMHTFSLCIGLVDLFFNLVKKALITKTQKYHKQFLLNPILHGGDQYDLAL